MSYPLFHPSCDRAPVAVLSAEEFAAEFPGESGYVEFKQGVPHDGVAETATAFSNADGGVILLGVADDGTLRGVDLAASQEVSLRNTLSQQVRDVGPHQIHHLDVAGQHVVAVSVGRRGDGFAQLDNGRVKERRGASNHTLMGAELADFIARRFVRTVESAPTRVRPEEINDGLAARLAEAWRWPVVRGAASSASRERLRDSGFLVRNGDGDRLSVAGALFLLADPAVMLGKAYVEVFRYRDDGLDYDRREEFRGPLQDQVGGAAGFVLDELGFDMALLGVRRHELHRLPRVVVREAIANAVAHRSYDPVATAEPVRIELRPERVVVRSPGALPEGVSLNDMAHRSVPRNVLTIRTLRYLGIAEDAGRGVRLMFDHMAMNLMAPPRFDADETSVTVTLPRGSEASPAERAWLARTLYDDPGQAVGPYSVGERGHAPPDAQPHDAVLLLRAARGETLTNGSVRDLLGVDADEARAAMQRLRDRDLLRQRGNGAGTTYVLAPHVDTHDVIDVPERLGKFHVSLGLADPDGRPRNFQAEVMELASGGRVTNATVRARTGLDRLAALKILNQLVAAGRLDKRGAKRGIHYVLPNPADPPPPDPGANASDD